MAATLAEGPAGLGAASPAQQRLQGPRNGLKKRQGPGPALIVGGWALHQLWLFWLAPILGAVVGGVVYRWLGKEDS